MGKYLGGIKQIVLGKWIPRHLCLSKILLEMKVPCGFMQHITSALQSSWSAFNASDTTTTEGSFPASPGLRFWSISLDNRLSKSTPCWEGLGLMTENQWLVLRECPIETEITKLQRFQSFNQLQKKSCLKTIKNRYLMQLFE